MRFTLRDQFWLTVVCAIICGWALNYKVAMDREAAQKIGKAWADAQVATWKP